MNKIEKFICKMSRSYYQTYLLSRFTPMLCMMTDVHVPILEPNVNLSLHKVSY